MNFSFTKTRHIVLIQPRAGYAIEEAAELGDSQMGLKGGEGGAE